LPDCYQPDSLYPLPSGRQFGYDAPHSAPVTAAFLLAAGPLQGSVPSDETKRGIMSENIIYVSDDSFEKDVLQSDDRQH